MRVINYFYRLSVAKRLAAALCVLLAVAIVFAIDPLPLLHAEEEVGGAEASGARVEQGDTGGVAGEVAGAGEPSGQLSGEFSGSEATVGAGQGAEVVADAGQGAMVVADPATVGAATTDVVADAVAVTSIIKLEIIGAEGNLKDAEFGFYADKADAISALIEPVGARPAPLLVLKTDELGKAESNAALKCGVYFLRELKAPKDYELDKEVLVAVLGESAVLVQVDKSQTTRLQASQSAEGDPVVEPAIVEPDEGDGDVGGDDGTGQSLATQAVEQDADFQERKDQTPEVPEMVLQNASLLARGYNLNTLAARNQGNPYTNGDLVHYTSLGGAQDLWLLNANLIVVSIRDLGSAPAPGFAIPAIVKAIDPVNITGWGASDFQITYSLYNPNSIIISNIGNVAHCIMPNNFTTTQTSGNGYFVLDYMENTSFGYRGHFFVVIEGSGIGDQATGGIIPVVAEWELYGKLALSKQSSNPSMTDGNDCYNLNNRVYSVYGSAADAAAGQNSVGGIDAGADGTNTSAWNFANSSFDWLPGTYYVKETVAPTGYAIDTTIYPVTVSAGQTAWVNGGVVYDAPLDDPSGMLVQKLDATTGEAYGKDDPTGESLAGAEFTVKYYDGYYDSVAEAEASGAATRTWVFLTEVGGYVDFYNPVLKSGSDSLYFNPLNKPTIPLGTVTIQETTPPPGYLLPTPNTTSLMQIVEDPSTHTVHEYIVTDDGLGSHTRIERLNPIEILEEPHTVKVEKYDADNNQPLADTEFTLYRETSKGSGSWTEITTHTTDENGKCLFSPVVVGSYKLSETRPNPLFATVEESGDTDRFFDILPSSTGEVQVFQNDAIQISCEVYKQTIALTSSAFDGTEVGHGSNVGIEEYLYHFGGRSTANVRADEFAITDDQTFINSLGYQMTTLWTGTSPAGLDHDNKMAILYKTNFTNTGEAINFGYHPLTGNPFNANNTELAMVFSNASGWRIWAEELSTTTVTRLDVSALGLAADEYITGLKVVYGGVEKGFYAGNGWETTDDPHTVKVHSLTTLSGEVLLQADEAITTEDFYYNVKATRALVPIDRAGNETVMRGSIRADIARNAGVLTDSDVDEVQTRVIGTFSYEDLLNNGFFNVRGGMPKTGDNPIIWMLVGLLAMGGIALTTVYFVRRRKQKNR